MSDDSHIFLPLSEKEDPRRAGGPIAGMAKNPVAANLMMAVLLVGGLFMAFQVKQEVFPQFTLNLVNIAVPYPGASPEEVEEGVILAIEERIRGLEGIKRISATANEGAGVFIIELLDEADPGKLLQDIKVQVDSITTFPQDIERPIITLLSNAREVISLVLYGDQEEWVLKRVAERVRAELLADPRLTLVDIYGLRPLEISIEVPQAKLRSYNLTLDGIAGEVRRTSRDLPGGGVKTESGEVLLRTTERRDLAEEYRSIPVLSRPDGTVVRIGDIATVTDDFADTDEVAMFNGQPAVMLQVYRTGEQTPISIAKIVKEKAEELRQTLPDGISVAIMNDHSEWFRGRATLLLRNAALGLMLVMVMLTLFLEFRLAFWATVGILVSFLGSFLLVPLYPQVSINMISLFAFIVALGIVVDDAIVVGENTYEHRRRGLSPLHAAIAGTRQVAVPVTFSVLTNIVAFVPMFLVPGVSGKFFRQIPAVVVSVFMISLLESLFILPAHLAHERKDLQAGFLALVQRGLRAGGRWLGLDALQRRQQRFSRWVERAIRSYYTPVLRFCLRYRYLTVATAFAVLAVVIGMIKSGRIEQRFMPDVESDTVQAEVILPFGSPVEETKRVQAQIVAAARKVLARHGGDRIVKGIYTQIGGVNRDRRGPPSGVAGGGHQARIKVFLVSSDERGLSAKEFTNAWREAVGDLPGLESLVFTASIGGPSTTAVAIRLMHPEVQTLEQAASELAQAFKSYAGTKDIDNGFSRGKPQLDFTVRPEARSLGITPADLGRQVRHSFYGAEALRLQRGRDEVKVMVRLPKSERVSEYNLEELMVRTPRGGEIPLREAAVVRRGHAYTRIQRVDGGRTMTVSADVEPRSRAGLVLAGLLKNEIPKLQKKYPGLGYSVEGERKDRREAMISLGKGMLMALLVIFAMMAIPFKSYVQPVIIITVVPFGILGAVFGHLIMGVELSIISMFGIVALSGVVVNDSLVLIDFANRARRAGYPAMESIVSAGVRRFRPILLTSVTTFGGLAPMIFETSVQAKFLIPMAISLGYGILFATVIALLFVPAFFLIIPGAYHQRRQGLPGLYGSAVTGGSCQNYQLTDVTHVRFQFRIYQGWIRHRKIAQMHALRRIIVHRSHQVLIYILSDERHKRAYQLGQFHQYLMKSFVGGDLVAVHLRSPVSISASPDVPVA